jgi:hypothetical protein
MRENEQIFSLHLNVMILVHRPHYVNNGININITLQSELLNNNFFVRKDEIIILFI